MSDGYIATHAQRWVPITETLKGEKVGILDAVYEMYDIRKLVGLYGYMPRASMHRHTRGSCLRDQRLQTFLGCLSRAACIDVPVS